MNFTRIVVAAWLFWPGGQTAGRHEKMSEENTKRFYAWAQPVKPYRIIGNLYYVGSNELTSFLITTPNGRILLDAGLEGMAPRVEENIEALSFHVADVKILLNSQAHIDHASGFAELKKVSGAKLMVSEGDAPVIESGGAADFLWSEQFRWEPAKVDRLVKDGDRITLGGVTMVAHLTPGHTKGCTTWTLRVREKGKVYNVVFVGSVKRIGAKLMGNEKYPRIAEDFQKSFGTLKNLKCDVFLAAHASFYEGLDKADRLAKGESLNPFLDSKGYRNLIEKEELEFHKELEQEKEAAGKAAAVR